MKMNAKKPSSVEEYRLESSFVQLQSTLRQEGFADRLDHPLAYWARPSDRRLPLTFLGWPLRDLLAMPFEELLATPGVGYKKISSLLGLLARVAENDLLAGHLASAEGNGNGRVHHEEDGSHAAESDSPPANVSEALWTQWRETVRRHGLGATMLGRLAPTLQELPTVIWTTPLAFYVDRTVTEIRHLKTHGEKRVRVVLEVFSIVHAALGASEVRDHLTFRLVPRFMPPLESWIISMLAAPDMPTAEEIRQGMAAPLLEQVRIDVGDAVAELAAERLGMHDQPKSVRQQARERQVTRARIYQLFEDCARVMQVRWPEGEWLLAPLEQKLVAGGADEDQLRLFSILRDLFFPRTPDSPLVTDHHGPKAATMALATI